MDISNDDLRLINGYLDNVLSAEEISGLEDKLNQGTEFADQFARCALTHRQITELLTEEKLHTLLDRAVGVSPSLPRELMSNQLTIATQALQRGGSREAALHLLLLR
jgi:hypothetical protein